MVLGHRRHPDARRPHRLRCRRGVSLASLVPAPWSPRSSAPAVCPSRHPLRPRYGLVAGLLGALECSRCVLAEKLARFDTEVAEMRPEAGEVLLPLRSSTGFGPLATPA